MAGLRANGWLARVSAIVAGLLVVGAATVARNAFVTSESVAPRSTVVHAERSGLRLGLEALSGRVSLVASAPAARWRVVGVTGWRQAQGRVLVGDWNTTTLSDGAYRLEVDSGSRTTRHTLFIRNYTYLPPTLEANASIGLDTRPTDSRAVVAAFGRQSYRPGEIAVLELWGRHRQVRVELLRVGPEQQLTVGNETMEGIRVAGPLGVVAGRRSLRIRIGDWTSGVYTARLTSGRKVGFAPFIVRPKRLGEQPVAVVQPTNTWQAYNYRCANGDGIPDTWYYTAKCRTVDVSRPYLSRGVPPHFRQYDLTFLRWLARTGRGVDMLAQEDLERVSGVRLARLYRLIIFPGHHEYVTEAEYDAVQRYRDLGGNLAFLSANNFFWRVNRRGDQIDRIGLWRDLGRSEAALVGVQYFDWNHGTHGSRPYIVRGAKAVPWLFEGTSLGNGDGFGQFGIEADRRTPASPRSIRVLAVIPNVFDSGHPAEMTYYRARSGGSVFAAGAFTLSGTHLRCSTVARFLENLFGALAGPTSRELNAIVDLGPCPLDAKL